LCLIMNVAQKKEINENAMCMRKKNILHSYTLLIIFIHMRKKENNK